MNDKTEIIEKDDHVQIYYYEADDRAPSKEFEIAQDPIVGDWCACNVSSGGAGEFYVETRSGAIQYALQRCGVIENGEWTPRADQTF